MTTNPIHDVDHIPPEAKELFEAAGYMDAKTILDHKISDIIGELVKANNVLKIIEVEPNQAMLMQWLMPLEKKFGKTIHEDEFEIEPSLLIEPKDILNTPFALPLAEHFVKDHNIELDELPQGKALFLDRETAASHYNLAETGAASYNVMSSQSGDTSSNDTIPDEGTALFEDLTTSQNDAPIIDKKRILKIETYQNEGSKIALMQRDEGANLTKSTRKETNEGVNPNSRFFIKGVLHKSINRFKIGCILFVLVNALILISFIITSLVLLDKDEYRWAVLFPLLGLLALIIYFTGAQKASCPICNQKQFAPKRCLRHKNAHRWPIFGYMLPTAIHALFFKWFRCIFCGTSVRLKE